MNLKRLFMPLVITAGVVVMLVSLLLLSKSTQNSADFDRLHVWLLLLNAVAVVVLLIVIGVNLFRLILQYQRNVTGSRLTTRLVAMFVALAIVPVVLVYYFSIQFISRGIDSWFDVRVERALSDAIDLSRSALELRVHDLLLRTQRMGNVLALTAPPDVATQLDALRRQSGATELTLLSGFDGHIIAYSSAQPAALIPDLPGQEVMMQVRSGSVYVGLDPVADNGLHIRAVVPVIVSGGWRPQILQALFPVADQQSGLANRVQAAYSHYRELTVLRQPLKYSFMLTLSLVLLLSVLMAVWVAFMAARKLVAPIQNLVEGTRAVARGDFNTRLPLPSHDEVGYLVSSFNQMTQRLAEAQTAARRSREQVESERSYLGAVLGRLSSGVISFNAALTLKTANPAAGDILGADLHKHLGRSLLPLAGESTLLGQFVTACRAHLEAQAQEWREEMVLHGPAGRRMLMVSCTTLPGAGGESPAGYVMVFDDLTALIEAQREAAWGEVARRLAHEIKNPLTPIQLAAERVRRKYLGGLKGEEADLLDRATHTIVQQVEAMKSMVNAFSEYARAPRLEFAPLDLNALVREAAELYREREGGMDIRLKLDEKLPAVHADAGRVRQMLHNLLKNAQEALEGQANGWVQVGTHYYHRGEEEMAEIAVEDNGPGFNAEILGKAFEPYVTSKPKGTGLGLAIVKKLAEEHGGSIQAQNNPGGGAQLIIRLPVTESARSSALLGGLQRRSGKRKEVP